MIHAREEKPDVIMITESWLNMRDKHLTREAAINGYTHGGSIPGGGEAREK